MLISLFVLGLLVYIALAIACGKSLKRRREETLEFDLKKEFPEIKSTGPAQNGQQ